MWFYSFIIESDWCIDLKDIRSSDRELFDEGRRRRHLDEPEEEPLQSSDKLWTLRLWTQPFLCLPLSEWEMCFCVLQCLWCWQCSGLIRSSYCPSLSASWNTKWRNWQSCGGIVLPWDAWVGEINAQSELQILKPSGFCFISSLILKLNICIVQLGG